jgi:hypothetical protein
MLFNSLVVLGAINRTAYGVPPTAVGETCRGTPHALTGADGGVETFVFANGTWTRNDFDDSRCPGGNRSTMTMPLPQPPENPISELTGHGYRDSTGEGCIAAGNIADTFTRTGD